jgi:hypothetical protein
LCSKFNNKLFQIFSIEITNENIIWSIAIEYSSFNFFLYFFDHLYHYKSNIHVSLLLIAMFSINKFSQDHLRSIIWRQALVFTWLAHTGRRTSKLLDSFLSAQRAFLWTHIAFFESWTEARASRTSYNTSFNIHYLNNACRWLEPRLISGCLKSWFLWSLDLFSSNLKLDLKFSYFFSKWFNLHYWDLIFFPQFFKLSFKLLNFFSKLNVLICYLSLIRDIHKSKLLWFTLLLFLK